MRFRNISMILGSLATLLLVLLTDPSISIKLNVPFGGQTVLALKTIVSLSLAAMVMHLGRKTLFDYIDIGQWFNKAKESPEGAAIATLALAVFMLAFAIIFGVLAFML